MIRRYIIILPWLLVLALPFMFRRQRDVGDWRDGDPVLVIISPHNEAIRYEFGWAFSEWHREHYGKPVKVDWRSIGGTSEIMRYLGAEYTAAFRAWWKREGREWPGGGRDWLTDRKLPRRLAQAQASEDATETSPRLAAWEAFRAVDDPVRFTCKVDLFFGGGSYDHGKAYGEGLTVAPWPPGAAPPGTLRDYDGAIMIPEKAGGEIWRTKTFFGAALSTFGICYNVDRVRDLGLPHPPARWADLEHPAYYAQVGVGDPTKSGSMAKAFEMIIHERMREVVHAAGFDEARIEHCERVLAREGRSADGAAPEGITAATLDRYERAIAAGWLEGLRRVQRIGANARYFTDGAGKVPSP